jgi:uncharacterized protein (DUF1778 family)
MTTKELNIKDARFDTRLSKDQKVFFERAARLGGFRNFTDFVVLAIQEKAKAIIAEKEQVIASEKDSEIFFDALLNPQKPKNALVKAAKEFKSHFSK